MHIASGLTLVRRDPAQSDGRTPRRAWLRILDQAGTTYARVRKMLPGAILLSVLAALGAMFPILF
jgi:hypothetical protein